MEILNLNISAYNILVGKCQTKVPSPANFPKTFNLLTKSVWSPKICLTSYIPSIRSTCKLFSRKKDGKESGQERNKLNMLNSLKRTFRSCNANRAGKETKSSTKWLNG